MAVGDVADHGHYHSLEVLTAQTTDNGQPSAATDGVEVNSIRGPGGLPESVTFFLASTAGSGTMTVSIRVWGYSAAAAAWSPLGTGTGGVAAGAGVKGMLNDGAAIDEVEANTLQHSEPLGLPGHFTRLYFETLSIGGTATAVSAWLQWQVVK